MSKKVLLDGGHQALKPCWTVMLLVIPMDQQGLDCSWDNNLSILAKMIKHSLISNTMFIFIRMIISGVMVKRIIDLNIRNGMIIVVATVAT